MSNALTVISNNGAALTPIQSAVLAELDALGLVALVGFRYLAHNADSHLSLQAKAFAQGLIDQLLQGELIGRLLLKRNVGHVVTRRVEPLHRLKESGVLLRRRREFDHQCCVHTSIIEGFLQCVKSELSNTAADKSAYRIPPPLESGGFLRRFP